MKCQCLKIDGKRCTRKAQTDSKNCWQRCKTTKSSIEEWRNSYDYSKLDYEEDKIAVKALLQKDIKKLKRINFHTRILISEVKNDLESLETLLKLLGRDPGAGSYFYTEVTDNKTFDLYKKYGITAMNLSKSDVTPEQWNYLYKIGYITKEAYKRGAA